MPHIQEKDRRDFLKWILATGRPLPRETTYVYESVWADYLRHKVEESYVTTLKLHTHRSYRTGFGDTIYISGVDTSGETPIYFGEGTYTSKYDEDGIDQVLKVPGWNIVSEIVNVKEKQSYLDASGKVVQITTYEKSTRSDKWDTYVGDNGQTYLPSGEAIPSSKGGYDLIYALPTQDDPPPEIKYQLAEDIAGEEFHTFIVNRLQDLYKLEGLLFPIDIYARIYGCDIKDAKARVLANFGKS